MLQDLGGVPYSGLPTVPAPGTYSGNWPYRRYRVPCIGKIGVSRPEVRSIEVPYIGPSIVVIKTIITVLAEKKEGKNMFVNFELVLYD